MAKSQMRRKQASTGGSSGSNNDVYDTDPPRPSILTYPASAAAGGNNPGFQPLNPGSRTNRGMSFPGAGSSQFLPSGAGGAGSAGGAGGAGSGGAGSGGVGVGDVDPRLKGGKKGGFKDWKRR